MKGHPKINMIYSSAIKERLPEADIPFDGVKGWILQGAEHQIVFFEIEPIGKVSEHAHDTQWGVVFDGKMDLTIEGETRTYRKGDCYLIPSGIVHSATFMERTLLMDFFDERLRYRIKI